MFKCRKRKSPKGAGGRLGGENDVEHKHNTSPEDVKILELSYICDDCVEPLIFQFTNFEESGPETLRDAIIIRHCFHNAIEKHLLTRHGGVGLRSNAGKVR